MKIQPLGGKLAIPHNYRIPIPHAIYCRITENDHFGYSDSSLVKKTTNGGIRKRDTESMLIVSGHWAFLPPIFTKKSTSGFRKKPHLFFGKYAAGFLLASSMVPVLSGDSVIAV